MLSSSAWAAEPLQFHFVHRAPRSLPAREPFVMRGKLMGARDVERVELVFRTSISSLWQHLALTPLGNDDFEAVIPAEKLIAGMLEYYVVALDFLEARHAAFASPASPARVPVDPASASASRPVANALSEPVKADDQATTALSDVYAAIDRATILSIGARDLLDILALVPELDVALDGSGFARVTWRGRGEQADLLLLIDQQVVNNPYDGKAPWRLPATLIAKVEVYDAYVPQMASALGFTSVIAVTTYAEPHTEAVLRAGSSLANVPKNTQRYGSYALSALLGKDLGDVVLSGYAHAALDDGALGTVQSDAYSGRLSQTPGPVRDQNIATDAAFTVRVPAVPGRLVLDARYLFERRGGYAYVVDTFDQAGQADWHVGLLGLTHSYDVSPTLSVDSRLVFDLQEVDRQRQLAPQNFVLSDRDGNNSPELFADGVLEERAFRTLRSNFEVQTHIKPNSAHTLTLAPFFTHERVHNLYLGRNIDSLGVATPFGAVAEPPLLVKGLARSTLGLRVTEEFRPTPTIKALAGLRFAYLSDLNQQSIAKQLSPVASVRWSPTPSFATSLSYTGSFRPPTFAERTDDSATTLPSGLGDDRALAAPLLRPAARHQLELLGSYRTQVGGLQLNSTARLFYARFTHTIAFVPQSGAGDAYSQRPKIDAVGAVVSETVSFLQRSHVTLALTWRRAWEGGTASTYLVDTPQLSGLLQVLVELGAYADASVVARYRSARNNNARTLLESVRAYQLPADTTFDVAVRTTPLLSSFRVGLLLHNAFNAQRQDAAPRPDRTPPIAREGLQLLATLEVAP